MTSQPSCNTPTHTSAPEGMEWRRFWRIFFLATLAPLAMLLALAEWLGWSTGETYTPRVLIHALEAHPDMVWMGDRVQAHARMKLAQVARARPEVLIMGQSRLGQLRESMFRPYTFYNMSRVSWPFNTYAELLRRMPPGYRPKLILFNADFFMFGPKYDEHYGTLGLAPVYDHLFHEHMIDLHDVITELFAHPRLLWQRTDYLGHPARGISAITLGDAFRKDGSEQPPAAAMARAGKSAGDLLNPKWKEYITGGQEMGEAQIEAFKQFVALGRAEGIPMIAIQMPMYGPAVREFEKDPNYRILGDFRRRVARGFFGQLGIPFFDYINFPPYSEDYRYFFDAVHPGAPLTAAVIEALGADPRIHALLPRLDMQELRRELQADQSASQHVLQTP